MFFRKLLTTISSNRHFHSPSIDRKAFLSRSFIYATDLASSSEIQHSGVNTNSQSLSAFLKDIYTNPAQKPDQVFLTSFSDAIMEITKMGVVMGV